MHTSHFQPPYRIVNRAGETWSHKTFEGVVEALRATYRDQPPAYWGGDLGEDFRQVVTIDAHGRMITTPSATEFVVRDAHGDAVPAETVIAHYRAQRAEDRRTAPLPGNVFRDGPWIGVRKRRGRYRGIRHVRTQMTRAWEHAHDDDIVETGRPLSSARRRRAIPHAWDDIPRARHASWKKHRLTRYRVRP